MRNQSTDKDRRAFWLLLVLTPAVLALWPVWLCIFGE